MIPCLDDMEQQRDGWFWANIRQDVDRGILDRKLNGSWAANDFKIYPSSLKSLTMCPHRFVHVDVHEPFAPPTWNQYKMDRGNDVHRGLQDRAKNIPGFLYRAPDFSYFDSLYPEYSKMVREKQLQHWPEVPVFDPESGISGRADLVLDIRNRPVVFDIKTMSVYQRQWDKKNKVWKEECWGEKQKELPKKEQEVQLKVYSHLINKFRYYPDPIELYGFGFLNLLIEGGDPTAEMEVYQEFGPVEDQEIDLLRQHLAKERRAFLRGESSQCSYPQCRAHNKLPSKSRKKK